MRAALAFAPVLVLAAAGCTTLPEPKVDKVKWPKEAYKGAPDRPYKTMGLVRTRVDYLTLDPIHEESYLCQNAFNKAARDLVKRAKDAGGDAVADVKSITFLIDGRVEKHVTAECTDEGAEGELKAQGIVVKWLPPGSRSEKTGISNLSGGKPVPVPAPSPVRIPRPDSSVVQ